MAKHPYFSHGDLGQRLALRRDDLLHAIADPSSSDPREAQLAELKLVEGALKRMREGSYGGCMECRCAISELRLRAQPTALRCLECQVERESEASAPIRRR